MRLVREADGRVHFSTLREMRKSPMHYRYACERKREPTRAMLVGSVTDRLVFGYGRVAVFEGVRRGKAWDVFRCMHATDTICSDTEYSEASGAANAVRADPVAGPVVRSSTAIVQRVLQWRDWELDFAAGIPGEMGRGGIDLYDPDTATIYDLKTTNDVSRRGIERSILTMAWHAQADLYSEGAKRCGLEVDAYRLICVESAPPHCVVVYELMPELIALGRKSIAMWTTQLRSCEAADAWPGYAQEVVELGVPEWCELTDE